MRNKIAKRILDRTPEHTKKEVEEYVKKLLPKKVSFDFDSTLDMSIIQELAKELVEKGVEVWVVTSRLSDGEAPSLDWNKDLWKACEYCGISKKNTHFTAYKDKWEFFKDKDFVWHLDDDIIELSMIKDYTNVEPICHFDWGLKYGGKENWKEKCLKLLDLKK